MAPVLLLLERFWIRLVCSRFISSGLCFHCHLSHLAGCPWGTRPGRSELDPPRVLAAWVAFRGRAFFVCCSCFGSVFSRVFFVFVFSLLPSIPPSSCASPWGALGGPLWVGLHATPLAFFLRGFPAGSSPAPAPRPPSFSRPPWGPVFFVFVVGGAAPSFTLSLLPPSPPLAVLFHT